MPEKPTFPVSISGDDYDWVEAEIMDYLEASSKYDEAVRENKTLRMTWFNHDTDDRSRGYFNLINTVDGDLQYCEGRMAKSIVGYECDECPEVSENVKGMVDALEESRDYLNDAEDLEEYGSLFSRIKNSSAKPYIISGLVSLAVAIVVASVAKK